ncbi:hypothetical protein Patl1_37059 [Pistacia atlantica]|nr:hypothetical protein Patl1_37059 [Pistacia atlantica]
MASKLAFLLILSIYAVNYGDSSHHAAAPAPAVDCTSLILDMADCLSFVSSGMSLSPAGAPGESPSGAAAASPATNAGQNEQAPAPSPGVSASSMFTFSLGSLMTGLAFALFCSFVG